MLYLHYFLIVNKLKERKEEEFRFEINYKAAAVQCLKFVFDSYIFNVKFSNTVSATHFRASKPRNEIFARQGDF